MVNYLEFTRHLIFWHISYAECLSSGGEYPILPEEHQIQEIANKKHPKAINEAILRLLEQTYPGLSWGYGLKDFDFINNAKASLIAALLQKFQKIDTDIEENIRVLEKTCSYPIQSLDSLDSLPVPLGPLLNGTYRHLKWPTVEGQLSSEGSLLILRRDLTWEQLINLRNKLVSKIENYLLIKIQIRLPSEKSALTPVYTQELVYLACVSWIDALNKITCLIQDHIDRGILVVNSKNSIYSVKRQISEISSALQYIRNWIVYVLSSNEFDLTGLHKLDDISQKILKILEGCAYSEDKVLAELRTNSNCLKDAVMWYNNNFEDQLYTQMGYDVLVKKLALKGWKL